MFSILPGKDLIILAKPSPPSWRFLWQHPAHLIACGLGSGLSPVAPGTVGTLFAWFSYASLRPWFEANIFIVFLLGMFVLGVWACHKTGKALGVPDHGSMVWDEIVPFWAVLFFCPPQIGWQAMAFVLFRIFDIFKPPPVRYFDALKNGFGVMADDACAAAYTLLSLAAFREIMS